MKLAYILAAKKHPEKVFSVSPDTSIQHAVDLLCQHEIGALVVLDPDTGNLAGILSHRDILRSLCSKIQGDLSSLRASDLMTREVITAGSDMEAHHALALMTERHIRHLPIVDDGQVKGILSNLDIMRELQLASELRVHSLSDFLGGTYRSDVY